VVVESLAVKHQLLIMKRSRRRAPNLTAWDRLMLGFWTLLVSPKRLRKIALIIKPSTLLRLHQALVKRKCHLLCGSNRARRPGPSSELIAAVVEMKRRNPRWGCRKIAEQISSAFGLEINKDVVRRILIHTARHQAAVGLPGSPSSGKPETAYGALTSSAVSQFCPRATGSCW
jgi:putative transposase